LLCYIISLLYSAPGSLADVLLMTATEKLHLFVGDLPKPLMNCWKERDSSGRGCLCCQANKRAVALFDVTCTGTSTALTSGNSQHINGYELSLPYYLTFLHDSYPHTSNNIYTLQPPSISLPWTLARLKLPFTALSTNYPRNLLCPWLPALATRCSSNSCSRSPRTVEISTTVDMTT
jgi:hypothetical protein